MDSPSALFNSGYDFNLDTPSRLAGGPGSPWGFSLTPYKTQELNPFESSFDTIGSKSKAFTAEDIFIDCTPGGSHVFGKRKRALSTPSLLTPGGSGLNHNHSAFAHGISDVKRPRLDAVSDVSSLSYAASNAFNSGASSGTVDSPASSTVPTPPDSAVIPPLSLDSAFPALHAGVTKDAKPTIDPEFSYQSILNATAQAPAYQQFVVPPTPIGLGAPGAAAATVAPFSFMESQRGSYAASGAAYVQPAPAPVPVKGSALSASLAASDKSAGKTRAPSVLPPPTSQALAPEAPLAASKAAPAKGKRGRKALARAESVSVHEDEAELEDGDDEARRKMFLERNRVAACKSRQKKKERVGYLETQASDYCARNVALQSVAVSLRQEVMALRQMLAYHDGCTCEHVHGYLKRETSGGGIPTIDYLAGRTMRLDYTNTPTMGSESDLYADIVRDGALAPAAQQQQTSAGRPSVGASAARQRGMTLPAASNAGPAIPLKNFAPESVPAVVTRSGAHRSSSAPPVTPDWEGTDVASYFNVDA